METLKIVISTHSVPNDIYVCDEEKEKFIRNVILATHMLRAPTLYKQKVIFRCIIIQFRSNL